MKTPLVIALGPALLLLCAPVHAQPSRVCNRIIAPGTAAAANIATDHMLRRSTVGNSSSDPALWPANVITAYHRAWEGYFYMDTSNPVIWIGSGTTSDIFTWPGPTAEVVQRSNTGYSPGIIGDSTRYYLWPSNQVEHTDIRIMGPTSAGPPAFPNNDIRPFHSTSCVRAQGSALFGPPSEAHGLAHELGHSYGYDHLFDWLVTLQPYSGMWSCELGTAPSASESMYVVPSAYEHQCHDIEYGLYDAIDLSINPHWASCGGSCGSTINGSATAFTVPTASTLYTHPEWVRFTTLSNRDSWTGSATIRLYLSRNLLWDSGDAQIWTYNTYGWQAGDTTTRAAAIQFNPQTAMPTRGVPYYLLIVVDPQNAIFESRESNNVTDTGFSFIRP